MSKILSHEKNHKTPLPNTFEELEIYMQLNKEL